MTANVTPSSPATGDVTDVLSSANVVETSVVETDLKSVVAGVVSTIITGPVKCEKKKKSQVNIDKTHKTSSLYHPPALNSDTVPLSRNILIIFQLCAT